MSAPLTGQVALVTGASSGIGEAAARALAAAGARVVVVARREARLQAVVAQIESAGGQADYRAGDITDEAFALGVVKETVERCGRLDILVNSAGTIQATSVGGGDLQLWRETLELNLLASLYTCHAAIVPMRARGGGTIINVGSLACRTTSPVYNAYATSKHALYAMNDGLRQELGADGIRVALLLPGTVTTEIWTQIKDPQHSEAIRAHLNQEAAILPDELAAAIVHIATAPQHVNLSEVWVRATRDTAY
ncbi:SDR family oxidoreductase [Mangrovimicrobium sediminis]|uniref:SDR family oxidoreductase n=1 Tax=Mangrovimicrobium sediminis TaxID=2562682 RepID=UPI001436880F|nr:SDR family NAD(P)-dependent oxidoreductase [Haliea sp. SAOS-164]